MPITDTLCAFAFSQWGVDRADMILRVVTNHVSDHSRQMLRVLEQCNRRAWKALEIALAGESLWTRLDRADSKALRAQIRTFLEQVPLPDLGDKAEFRARCLTELRSAFKTGVLLGELVAGDLAEKAGGFARFSNPHALMTAEKTALERLGREVQAAGFEALGWLLAQPARAGESVVVVAVRYYFRREAESNQELFRGLQLSAVELIGQAQEDGFRNLDACVAAAAGALETALEDATAAILGGITTVRGDVGAVHDSVRGVADSVRGVHDSVKEIRGTVAEATAAAVAATDAARVHAADTARRIDDLQTRVAQLLDKLDMADKPVGPAHSVSIRSDRERELVKGLLAQVRSLPGSARAGRPDLTSGVGKLQLAVGDFSGAGESFATAAATATSVPARAEAHHNAYQAKLEQGEWAGALAELIRAVALDPDRFSPFPFDKYIPDGVLGAGGFGVTFRCRHRLTEAPVAVKAITDDDLDRDAGAVLKEAMTLDRLKHPAIIGLRDCGFGDEGRRRRPYLVMEYFDGPTLQAHVAPAGPVPLADLLPLATTLAEALKAAHGQGVLHRDVKPANVLVKQLTGAGPDGPARWDVRLIDFGLAMRADVLTAGRPGASASTVYGMSITGTLDYAAPEQLGKLPGVKAGPPADVYGFAKSLCFALFETTEPTNRHYRVLPEPVADLISRCLSRDPADRPRGFDEVLDALVRITPSTARSKPERGRPEADAPRPSRIPSGRSSTVPVPKARPVAAPVGDIVNDAAGPRQPDRREDPPDPPDRPERANDRMTHAMVAITLGWLGIHKYMQGNTANGTLRLIVGFLTCGIATGLVGIVEGIQYLTMSDARYARDYLRRRKDWF